MRLPTRQDGVENRDKVYCIRIKKRAGYSRRCKRKYQNKALHTREKKED